jgi:hypothetical protein
MTSRIKIDTQTPTVEGFMDTTQGLCAGGHLYIVHVACASPPVVEMGENGREKSWKEINRG